MTDNCMVACAWVEEDGMCNGECAMKNKPKLETLEDADLERGKSPHIVITGDENGRN